MTSAELAELRRRLRQMLPDEGIGALLAALKQALPEHSDKYNTVFQLEARLNTTDRDRLRGILSQEQQELAYNRLNADVLDLVNSLEEKDFDPASRPDSHKAGSILYRIPHEMDLTQEYRCVVRLAYEEEVVLRNIELTADTVLKSVRVSEVMEVDLADPNETPAFAIRKMNALSEQFLEKDEYTEWIFMVKPLRTGELPLMLRVIVVEIINDRERKKEIVLEELIVVVAEGAQEAAGESTRFKSAGYALNYARSGGPLDVPRPGRRSVAAAVAALLVAAGIWAAGVYLGWLPYPFGPSAGSLDRRDWAIALQAGTDSSFAEYLARHPQGSFADQARFKIDSLLKANAVPPDTLSFSEDTVSQKITGLDSSKPDKPRETTSYKPAHGRKKSGFDMVFVKGGVFTMGSAEGDRDECPHKKKVGDFYIGKYEVTQADWKEIMGNRPAFKDGCPDCPVENVSWSDVQAFIREAGKRSGRRFRLPTETEWEYAARGGQKSKGFQYAGSNETAEVAWFNAVVAGSTTDVGSKNSNELGLFDMSGNVREWCADTWKPYPKCRGNASTQYVVRGGSWQQKKNRLSVYAREKEKAANKDARTGFRLVMPKQ